MGTRKFVSFELCLLAGLALAPASLRAQTEDPIDKRAFGVLPNYRTADGTKPFTPIGAKQKLTIAAKDSFDKPIYFMAGFFAHGFARRLVDIDYHIAMGGRAYATRAGTLTQGPKRALGSVFAELADKFQPLVDALGEISDSARAWSQSDILRLYEIWLKTGSERARHLLSDLGVAAAPVGLRTH